MKVWAVIRVAQVDGVSVDSLAHVFSTEEKAVAWTQANNPPSGGCWVVDDYEVDEACPPIGRETRVTYRTPGLRPLDIEERWDDSTSTGSQADE